MPVPSALAAASLAAKRAAKLSAEFRLRRQYVFSSSRKTRFKKRSPYRSTAFLMRSISTRSIPDPTIMSSPINQAITFHSFCAPPFVFARSRLLRPFRRPSISRLSEIKLPLCKPNPPLGVGLSQREPGFVLICVIRESWLRYSDNLLARQIMVDTYDYEELIAPWTMQMKAVSAVEPTRLVQSLTGAILGCGGWVLRREANDSGKVNVSFEFERQSCLEIYTVLV